MQDRVNTLLQPLSIHHSAEGRYNWRHLWMHSWLLHNCVCVCVQVRWSLLTEGYVDTRINGYSGQIAEEWIIWLSYFNTRLARSLSPSIRMTTSTSPNDAEVAHARMAHCDGDFISDEASFSLFSILKTHNSPHSVSVCLQRVTFDPTPLPRTISPSSILYSSPCLINVIPVCLSINLYKAGAQWLSKTN